MSLQDQLLKAGLVSQEKAKKQAAEARKNAHRAKKDKAFAEQEAARKNQKQERLEAEMQQKRERDRQLNLAQEAAKKRREQAARAYQLIESHRLNEKGAEICYNFLYDDRRIRYVKVTPQQQRGLAMGQIGIARNDLDEYDFPLIPRDTALKVQEIDATRLLLLHEESDYLQEQN